jgi:glucose-1-phosphate thymidylyltransferase
MNLPIKGVILAGGEATRLRPLTNVTNKHLLPVSRKPMIYYPIEKMTGAGIEDILVVTGCSHIGEIVNLLRSGRDFGCRFTYRVQDEAGGIAQALGLAEGFAAGGPVAVILGDNLFEDPLGPALDRYRKQDGGAHLLLKEVDDPERFGVADVAGEKILGIEEKPKAPKSKLAVTGVYFYDADVYDIIRTLRPSARNELEITDVNNHYLRVGKLGWSRMTGWWSDAGTFDSLARVHRLVEERPPRR